MKDTGLGTYSLVCHPQTPAVEVSRIDVSWTVLGQGSVARQLMLRWKVEGAGRLVAPPFAGRPLPNGGRADNLWQHSCFELFLKGAGPAYHEFNFSPSQRWAAYAFSTYREGAGHLALDEAPTITTAMGTDTFTCTVTLPADVLDGMTHAGISAVIEEAGGRKSYWALAHMPGNPDFHRAECFTIAIAGDGQA